MSESRFQRWSRLKQAEREQLDLPEADDALPAEADSAEPELTELEINEALPEEEVLAKYDLPDPDSIELGTDITGFLRDEIPEFIRRKALRKLWTTNPVLAVLDGLNDYDEDYTDAAFAGQVVKTVYKVGQGMIDRTKKEIEKAVDDMEAEVDAAVAREAEPRKPDIRLSEPSDEVESDSAPEADKEISEQQVKVELEEPEEVATPAYRPRMRFSTE